MEEHELTRDLILELCSTEVENGRDILSVAADLIVVALNIYRTCLSEDEFTALMAMVFASKDNYGIPSDRMVH